MSSKELELKTVRSALFVSEEAVVVTDNAHNGTVSHSQHEKQDEKHPQQTPLQPTDENKNNSTNTNNDDEVQLPLEIQLALLEDTVFGWTHLTSTFFGHTMLPMLCYWVIHQACRHLLLLLLVKSALGSTNETATSPFPTGETNASLESTLWRIELFSRSLGLLALIGAFRFIRRKRRVWLRSAYGSLAYQKDRAHRRQSVRNTDRTNTLGKLMAQIQRKRRKRRLQRAKTRYAKKHLTRTCTPGNPQQRRRIYHRNNTTPTPSSATSTYSAVTTSFYTQHENNLSSPASSPNATQLANAAPSSQCSSFSSTDNWMPSFSDDETSSTLPRSTVTTTTQQPTSITQDHVAIPLIKNVAYAHGGFFGAAPFFLASPQWVRILRKLLPDVYVEISRRVLFSPAPKLIHWAENNPVVAAYGVVQSIKQEQWRHGRRMVEKKHDGEPRSSTPPRREDDDDNVQSRNVTTTTTDGRTLPTIEWDVFLNPRLVRRVEAVLDAKEKYHRDNLHGKKPQRSPQPPETYSENESERLGLLPQSNDTKCDRVQEYLETELRKRAQELTDKLLIAHGNTLQLIVEQTGFLKDFNYSRVQRTRQSLGGGMYARQWMAVFAEALRLGTKYDDDDNPDSEFTTSMEDMAWLLNDDDGRDDDDGFSAYLDYSLDTSMTQSLQLIQRITQTQQPISLVLDLKSRHVPKRVLGVVLDTLHSSGIAVAGIGSFQISEIRGVSSSSNDCDNNDSSTFSNSNRIHKMTKELLFLHSAGDLKVACEEGTVKPGDHVFFNGGSLIIESARPSAMTGLARLLLTLGFDGFDPSFIQSGYRIHACSLMDDSGDGITSTSSESSVATTMRSLHDYKRHYQFSMGVYVQEFSIDESAARLLIEHINEHSDLYDLGFAWGGVNGMSVHGIKPGRFTSTDGFWNQRHVGKLWT